MEGSFLPFIIYMVKSHKDQISADIVEAQAPRKSGGVLSLSEDNSDLTKIGDYDGLPNSPSPNKGGQIDWLGSSYSGTDITVVAHLYETPDLTRETMEVSDQKVIADLLVGGAELLSQNPAAVYYLIHDSNIAHGAMKASFLRMAGISGQDESSSSAGTMLFRDIVSNARVLNSVSVIVVTIQTALRTYKDFQQQMSERLESLTLREVEGSATIVLGTLQTITVQTHREKFEVRALGHTVAKGITRGPRTVAGSMIFTMFNEHALSELTRHMGNKESIWRDPEISSLLPDQLPPFDVTISFANEYGSLSQQNIYGIDFVNDGEVLSIEDLVTENSMNFMARDCDVLTKRGNVRLSRVMSMGGLTGEKQLAASELLFSNRNYDLLLERIGVRRRLFNR